MTHTPQVDITPDNRDPTWVYSSYREKEEQETFIFPVLYDTSQEACHFLISQEISKETILHGGQEENRS
jgi:hypothetical protein